MARPEPAPTFPLCAQLPARPAWGKAMMSPLRLTGAEDSQHALGCDIAQRLAAVASLPQQGQHYRDRMRLPRLQQRAPGEGAWSKTPCCLKPCDCGPLRGGNHT